MDHKGTLTVVSKSQQNPLNGGGSLTVVCECGNQFTCYKSRWDSFTGDGCGTCHRSRRSTGERNPKYKHGGNTSNKAEFSSYNAMLRRCYDQKFAAYKWYGAKGVVVCDRWKNKEAGFMNFLQDMGKRPKDKPTIDRINSTGNYEPSNCRWADWRQQHINTSRTKQIVINGESLLLGQWITKLGVARTTYYRRVKSGMTPIEALTA